MLLVDRRAKREALFDGERGVEAVLQRLAARGRGWTPVHEADRLIALARADGAAVTLEPGSQFELSTPPRRDVLQIDADLRAFLAELAEVTGDMDVVPIAIGLNPFSATDEVHLGPKKRYRIMTDYLSKRGDLALDMMRRTLSVHCSFDYADEADAAEKTRVAFAVAPIVTAMFANSGFEKLAPNGFQSFRGEVWRRTDPDRCGLVPEVFERDFGFERYVDVVLRVPLIFTYADGVYRPAHGLPAAKWFAGEWAPREFVEAHRGIEPSPDDLEWVINQSFRDARLRRYLECRASDFPLPEMASAPVALWTGVLYDPAARAAALELTAGLSLDERAALSGAVAKDGLRARTANGRDVLTLARDLLDLARRTLVARGFGEEELLDPAASLVASGRTPTDVLLERFPARADADALIDRLALR